MSIESLRDALPDFARDIKLNLGTVLSPDGAPELTQEQVLGIALASAYATQNRTVIDAISAECANVLPEENVTAAKAAATIMAMNNVYYRFTHYVSDQEIVGLPAKLRMNVIGNPGISKIDFELYSLAISAINGCGKCMEAHAHELGKAQVAKPSIQSAVRIAAVVNAASQAIRITQASDESIFPAVAA